MKGAVLRQILDDRADRRAVVLATRLETGDQQLLYPFEDDTGGDSAPEVLGAARDALLSDRSITLDRADGTIFLQAFNPPVRLVLVGAVHISQPLARMAALAGLDVVVIDPRSAFASEDRFPGVELRAQWPDEALLELGINRRTAVVTLTHDPKVDDPALQGALRSDAFFVGALGSRRTHAARLDRLREEGFGDDDLARIHGPVGLSIGARSPAEIAVAILGQIVERLRTGPE
jgi:xanthine dehydrogenase accessory factor